MQVLVRVVYAGVNPVETYIREGQYSRLPDLPYIPGSGTGTNTFNTRSIYTVPQYPYTETEK
jgi:hypothetical protein